MTLLDQVLNWAALLLWLNWRMAGFRLNRPVGGRSLVSTLQQADSPAGGRWLSLAGVFLVLGLRSFLDWYLGSRSNWTPTLDLCVIALPFRSDRPRLMLLFSVASFALLMGVFYACLLLISAANRETGDLDPVQGLVQLHLGCLERLPTILKVLFPFLSAALLWTLLSPYLAVLGLVPAAGSKRLLLEQAVVLGVTAFLAWKYLLLGLFLLHLLNSHVYLGAAELFQFASLTSRHLLRALDWLPLRWGRIDLTPALGIALVWLAAEYAERGLPRVYQRLPF